MRRVRSFADAGGTCAECRVRRFVAVDDRRLCRVREAADRWWGVSPACPPGLVRRRLGVGCAGKTKMNVRMSGFVEYLSRGEGSVAQVGSSRLLLYRLCYRAYLSISFRFICELLRVSGVCARVACRETEVTSGITRGRYLSLPRRKQTDLWFTESTFRELPPRTSSDDTASDYNAFFG